MLNQLVKPYRQEKKSLLPGVNWLRTQLFGRHNAASFERVHEHESTTIADRYPTVFTAAQEHFAGLAQCDLSILSYGSSTGEECFSLRNYFPDARITGVDSSLKNVAEANRKNVDEQIEFLLNQQALFDDGRRYDLIFALSVLCKWPETRFISDIGNVFPFRQFAQAITELDGLLKPGGMLVVYNANFRFEDVAIAEHYEPVEALEVQTDWVKKFSAENKELTTPYFNYLFKKNKS